jgi:alkylhydroperoxidase/carboxymuconolactone decarboxylase family protein YurZ
MSDESIRRKNARQAYKQHTGGDYAPSTSPVDPPAIEDLLWLGLDRNYGDAWSRPGLDLRTRSFITMTATAVLGCEVQLRHYIAAAHHVGITKEEVVEWLIHLNGYIGTPRTNVAMSAARDVWKSFSSPPAR